MADAKKNEIKPWRKQQWVIPPQANAAFVANRDDVFDTSRIPTIPSVRWCAWEPLPVRPGSPAKEDRVDERGGVAILFMAFEPLAGKRLVEVTERKTSVDFARFLRALSDEHYAAAEKIVLVCDNLSTHTPAAWYAAFAPDEARRLAERFEWHSTPKHGSWLNVKSPRGSRSGTWPW